MAPFLIVFVFYIAFTMVYSILYFYMYAKGRERYLLYQGLSWILYSFSLSFLLLGVGSENKDLISIRGLFDIYNILLLLYAFYSFAGKKIPTVWLRFSLYISIWAAVGLIFNFTTVSTYLPTLAYMALLSVIIAAVLFRYWDISLREKIILSFFFLTWGLGKAAVSMLAINHGIEDVYLYFISEILYSNILNFVLIIIAFRRSQNKLYSAEHIFQTITENASDIMMLVEPGGSPELKYISPSISTILGISEETVYNDTHAFVTFVHPDDWKTFDFLFSRKNRLRERNAVVRAYDTEGNMHWCDVTVKRVPNDQGKNLVEAIIRDITESQEAQQQMLQAKQSRDTLLSYVSHELKTPIASILGFSSALKDDLNLSEEQKKIMLETIYTKSITLNRLISDLVQLSKLETHQYSFEFSMYDCDSFASELWKRHQYDGQHQGIEFSMSSDQKELESYFIIADLDRVDQVFTNILSNGLRYTNPNKSMSIKFFIDRKKENFKFSITNFGSVISESDLLHLFDRFYRVDKGHKSASENNSGLGLTLSKEIIEAHNGNIDVTSDALNGTTFIVTIPLYIEERNY